MSTKQCGNERCRCVDCGDGCKCVGGGAKYAVVAGVVVLVLVAGLGIAMAGGNGDDGGAGGATSGASGGASVVDNDDGTVATALTVWGMTCRNCEAIVTAAAMSVSGVISVDVDLRSELVTVVHDETVDVAEIRAAIEARGYNIP